MPLHERRKYERYETDIKVFFFVSYDVKTTVQFQLLDPKGEPRSSEKYFGTGKNVSAAGLSFLSDRKLSKGEALHIEVYLPNSKDPILMKGHVCWCELSSQHQTKQQFETGVQLVDVNGEKVEDTIRYDDENRVIWSAVLEAIFGTFRILQEQKKKAK